MLPPPASLDAGQQFTPFTSLPALGNRANNTLGHVFTIPSINPSDEHRPNVASRLPHVPGYGTLSSHLPNSIYNITYQKDSPLGPQQPILQIKQELPPKVQSLALQQQQQQQAPQLHKQQAQTQQQPQPPTQLPQPQQPPHQHQQHPPQQPPQPVQQQGPPLDLATASALPEKPNAQPKDEDAARQIPLGVLSRLSLSNAYRPLNVKDALSYLDQVKIQFYNQADVYNNFLDIMKDFKSQSIDTPGVIDRVSTLFRGHPNLIQGFNTFLPPGYKIECSLDPADPNPIRVTTPTGTTTRPNLNGQFLPSWSEQAQHPQQPLFPQEQQPQGGQIEFNHAISYVNKIKTRFANQPDIYKQFLEILQTYQREQRPIGEVYEQVTQLFANSPDLLNDFKQFLPDTTNQSPLAQRPEDAPHPQLPSHEYYQANGQSQLPPLGNFQPNTGGPVPEQNFRYPQAHEDAISESIRKNSEHSAYENNYNEEATYSSLRGAPQAVAKQKSVTPNGQVQMTKVNSTLVPGIPEPVPPSAVAKSSSLSEELSFFDKVKKAIGNKQTYNEFLKMLNLFSQDIIDKDTLVERVESFLGDNQTDLLNWFKQFIGYQPKTQHMEDITFKKHQIELSLCKSYGPSYRQLPKVETYMPCSGRDEMCWEVLNDEWVGHPTWASEDSGFISHRKNQYEEILFKIEEERLEFDYHMEANLRTIQTLETIANRIANMTPEQKASFKLPPGLGHTSQTIYKKVIRKIYDKDRGFEVIDALQENPAVAVPVVLKRLKQKDEEWKRAQREWNKVWREMEQKVFYKSLDHLGLTFKQADKKLLTAKQLVSEISTVKVEQQNKRLHPLTPKPQEQLSYKFTDNDVIFDILRLSDFFIYHSSNYSQNDREKLSLFFKHFIALFFGIPNNVIEETLAARSSEASEKGEEESKSTEANGFGEQTSKKRNREQDLLRDVLRKQTKSRKEEADDVPTSEHEDSAPASDSESTGETWINTAYANFSLDESGAEEQRDKFNFFCLTNIYVFFRHFRTLYERLSEIKAMNKEVSEEIKSRKIPQFAKDLNLVSHQLQELGVEIVAGPKDCYSQVLSLAERLLDGDIEHQWFEESLREAYRNKAYKCYTLDKVVLSLVKYIHTMVTDSKTSEMIVLFEQDRTSPSTTARKQILYRMQVRSLMSNDENMFKITFHESTNSVNIQFVGLDDLTINDHANAEEQYNYYVTSYVMSHPTEGVPMSMINMPFHKNFIDSVEEEQCAGTSNSKLKVSICQNSFRLFFEKDTYDEFIASSLNKKEAGKPDTEKLETLRLLLDELLPEGTDSSFDILVKEGAEKYKEARGIASDEMDVDDTVQGEDNGESKAKSDTTLNADATIDPDSTLHEPNDTTIQQDAHDTTMEDGGSFMASADPKPADASKE